MHAIPRTQTIICYGVPSVTKLEIYMLLHENRELAIRDVSCELLLYGSADLCIKISEKFGFFLMPRIGLSMKVADCNL